MAGQLTDRVVSNNDLGLEVPDLGDEAADGLIEGSVDGVGEDSEQGRKGMERGHGEGAFLRGLMDGRWASRGRWW
ncbi:hypothetical protein GCM10010299_20960 [Streptomyces tanashiensis]|nr:hypothetical protein GCM10010299_20960 [Streptomyces tanashiensis]